MQNDGTLITDDAIPDPSQGSVLIVLESVRTPPRQGRLAVGTYYSTVDKFGTAIWKSADSAIQETITSNTTLRDATQIAKVKTLQGAFVVSMKVNPNDGDIVDILDDDSNASANNITVSGNGHTIMGDTTGKMLGNGEAWTLRYNGTGDWRLI